jgi:hypothetical protein
MPTDATSLVVPLWGAILAGFTGITTIIGTVVWVYATFERKADADQRHDSLTKRVSVQEQLLSKVAQDVSYIRGRLEPRE